MSADTSIASIFNIGREIKGPDGKVYTLRKPTLKEQGLFQRWLEQRAHDAVDRSTATEDAKDRRHARIDSDAAMGKYEYDGPYAQEALWQPAGLAKIVSIICGVDYDAAAEVVQHALREIAATLISKATSDPKAVALAIESLGLTTDLLTAARSAPSCSSSSTRPSPEPSPNSEASPTSSSSSCTRSSEAPMG